MPIVDKNMRILYVDDDARLRTLMPEVLGFHLEDRGVPATVRTAADADSALEMVAADNYDVLVTDKDMPGTNGEQLAGHLLGRGFRGGIVIYTGWGNYSNSSLISQGVKIAHKPFMKELVDRVLEGYGHQE